MRREAAALIAAAAGHPSSLVVEGRGRPHPLWSGTPRLAVGWARQWSSTPVVRSTEPKPVRVVLAASAGPSLEAPSA